VKVLGIDPGKRETFYATVERNPFFRRPSHRVTSTGHIELNPDTEINDRLPLIYTVTNNLIKTLSPDLVVAERFVVRPGRGMGNVSEIINQFLGVLYGLCARKNIRLVLVMPSVHKTWRDREGYRWPDLNPHETDAASLACYGYRRSS
jgi:Holliday junction resolvasome RuvABC endonuclease subunit